MSTGYEPTHENQVPYTPPYKEWPQKIWQEIFS
jgi:hypothetical protein